MKDLAARLVEEVASEKVQIASLLEIKLVGPSWIILLDLDGN